jgi:hypothetical protein
MLDLKEKVILLRRNEMDNEQKVVEATIVEAPVANPAVDAINAQKANFVVQLEAVKKEMADCQQKFEKAKIMGTKLEGAIESLLLLEKSLTSK